MPKAFKPKQPKKDKENKPAKFKQDKSEFNKIYNEVKRIAKDQAKGMQKVQLENDFRVRLGLKPKVIKKPYNYLLRDKAKEKKERELNAKKVKEEEGVVPIGFLPHKPKKEKKESSLKTTQGNLHGGILKFDIERDDALNFDEWGKYGKNKKDKKKPSKFGGAKNKKGGKKKGKK